MADILAITQGDTLSTGYFDCNDIPNCFFLRGTYNENTPGEISFQLLMQGTTAADVEDKVEALQHMFNRAVSAGRHGSQTWVTLYRKFGDAGTRLYDITGGRLEMQARAPGQDSRFVYFQVTIFALLAWRGAPQVVFNDAVERIGKANIISLPSIPGQLDALMRVEARDISTSIVINKMWLTRRYGENLAVTEWSPYITLVAASGAIAAPVPHDSVSGVQASVIDNGGSGGTTPADFVAVATASMPAGALNRQRALVLAKLKDNAVVTPAPTGLTAEEVLPTVNAEDANPAAYEVITTHLIVADDETWDASLDHTFTLQGSVGGPPLFSNPHVVGSALVVYLAKSAVTGFEYPPAPTGWVKLPEGVYLKINLTSATPAANAFVVEWDGLGGASTTVTLSGVMYELRHVDPNPLVGLSWAPPIPDGSGGFEAPETYDFASVDTLGPNNLVLASVTRRNGPLTDTDAIFWSNQFVNIRHLNGITLAKRTIEEASGSVSTTVLLDEAVAASTVMLAFKPLKLTSVDDEASYVEPTPGNMPLKELTLSVQAVDRSGTLSEESTAITTTPTTSFSAYDLEWTAPLEGEASYYRINIVVDGRVYAVHTPNGATSYRLTSIDQARSLSDIEEAGISSSSVRLDYGTVGGGLTKGKVHRLPAAAIGMWQWVPLGLFALPPGGQQADGTMGDWQVELWAASGGGPENPIQAEMLFLICHEEPSSIAGVTSLDLTTKREWVFESTRDGLGVSAYLQDLTTHAVIESLAATGVLTAAPGSGNHLAFGLASASGEARTNSGKLTIKVTIWPRYRW